LAQERERTLPKCGAESAVGGGGRGVRRPQMWRLCGRFKDDHQSPPSSENSGEDGDTEDLRLPKDHKKFREGYAAGQRFGKLKKKIELSVTRDTLTGLRLFVHKAQVTQRDSTGQPVKIMEDVLEAKGNSFSPDVLKKINRLNRLYRIELIDCDLQECPPRLWDVDSLRHLYLSHNKIKSWPVVALRSPKGTESTELSQLKLDNNEIATVEFGAFADKPVERLELLTLRVNKLRQLPLDFLYGAAQLKLLDLSHNSLRELPETIFACESLAMFIATHNQLVRLPESIDKLRNLNKLVLSFNQLEALPQNIGQCCKLERLRVVDNKLRELPRSIVLLSLDELMVDGNPLVQPSYTTFEMFGFKHALQIYSDWQRKFPDDSEKECGEGGEGGPPPALSDDGTPRLSPSMPPVPPVPPLTLAATGQVARVSIAAQAAQSQNSPHRAQAKARQTHMAQPGNVDIQHNETITSDGKLTPRARSSCSHDDYYFGHCDGDQAMIAQIRSSESAMLLTKKLMFVNFLRMDALKTKQEYSRQGKELPEALNELVSPSFDPTTYRGKCQIRRIDLYFCLLVYSTRAMCHRCETLFNLITELKQQQKAKERDNYFKRGKWHAFLNKCPITMPAQGKDGIDVAELMFQLMASRSRDHDRVFLADFVAGWHIHDVTISDPFVQHIANVHGLEFYDMDLEGLQAKLRMLRAAEANPELGSQGLAETQTVVPLSDLPLEEGERSLRRDAAIGRTLGALLPSKGTANVSQVARRVSSDEMPSESSTDSSDFELKSDKLDASSSECSSFSANEAIGAQARMVANDEPDAEKEESQLMVASDADMHKLMSIHPKKILGMARAAQTAREAKREADKAEAKSTQRRWMMRKIGSGLRDPRYRTDVFPVRQAVREVYRNMPFHDFVKLINFVLRELMVLKHAQVGGSYLDQTYWHRDDPSFRYTMGLSGKNEYTERLMIELGFAPLANTYWVWPAMHVTAHSSITDWGTRSLPLNCPGMDRERLDDAIKLMKGCQRALTAEGKAFTGHFNS